MASFRYYPIVNSALVVVLVAGFGTATGAIEFAGGTGEPSEPYKIATADQLIAIGSDPNLMSKDFILVNDIDLDPNLSGGRVFNDSLIAANPWYCANQTCFAFTGVFNGNGHVIRNLTINIPPTNPFDGCGLFGCVGRGGRVEALRLESVDINGHCLVGAFAAENWGAITHCHATGRVRGRQYVGGLVGRNGTLDLGTASWVYEFPSSIDVDGLIFACSADVEVGQRVDANYGWTESTWLGGLAGTNAGGVIYACRCAGSVSGQVEVGGLVGSNQKGWIRSSYAANRVYGGRRSAGGVVGENHGSILFCYAVGPLSLNAVEDPGGISGSYSAPTYLCCWDVETTGCTSSYGGRARTTSQMKNRETFRGWGYDGQWVLADGQDYPRLAWEGSAGEPIVDDPAPYLMGAGTAEDPYEVSTAEQLLALGYSWPWFDRHFILTADIDLSGIDPEEATSIGALAVPFCGSFDGNGHVVTGFRLWTRHESQVGLFGHVGPSGIVKNVVLADADIRGGKDVGALAGSNEGTILNCSTDGHVYGDRWVGGMLGHNGGTMAACRAGGETISIQEAGGFVGWNDGSIDSSRCVATVMSTDGLAGGFAVDNSGVISSSGSHSAVVGARRASGFVVYSAGQRPEIRDCYSLGSVEGTEVAGGFLGWNTPILRRCYSACVVRSDGKAGGFMGMAGQPVHWNTSVVESCYWDTDTSGMKTSVAGTGMTTSQMRQQASFVGWDFETVWMICEGRDYPRLRWEGVECVE